jgi:hypothetical protein
VFQRIVRIRTNPDKTNEHIANATKAVAIWTRWLVFVGILTAVVLGLQLRMLQQTDKTMRAGERAFVFVNQSPVIQWEAAQLMDGNIVTRRASIEWENSGNSQTKNLIVYLNCPRPQKVISSNPMTILDGNFGSNGRLLGPKQKVAGGVCTYNAEELGSVQRSGAHLYIVAKATYDDIFDEPHVTEYCGEVVSILGDMNNAAITPNNAVQTCGRNCADKECSQL